jgi:hypothetical protein
MRGHDDQAAHLFSYVSPEQRVPADHPLRAIRKMTDRGRWHVAGGVGELEEFQEGRRRGSAAGRPWQSDGEFSRGTAE